jgi:hypothetical protein
LYHAFPTPFLQFIVTWHLFVHLTAPSDEGFGLDTFQKATTAVKSLCAQFEHLCAKYAKRFLKKLSVSYIKLLTVPAAILKHGWTDELAIDSRMKGIWGSVGVTGGCGGNAEEWALKGFNRSLSLLEVRLGLKDEKRNKTNFIQFELCPKFQFHHHIPEAQKNTYISFLQFMYAGDVGVVIADAFRRCAPNWDEEVVAEVRSLSLSQMHFFEKLCITGEDPAKCFNTFLHDTDKPQKHGAIPRVGANAIVTGVDDRPLMIRIEVWR